MSSYTIYHVSGAESSQELWPYGKPVIIEVKRTNSGWRVQRWAEQHPKADVWVREADTLGNVRWHHMTPERITADDPDNYEHAPWLVAKWFEILDLTRIVCEGERI